MPLQANAVQPVTTTPEPYVVLKLSRDQAETLYVLLGAVSGTPGNTPRGDIAAIHNALSSAGVRSRLQVMGGNVWFSDYRDGR